jgi:MoxR-like ATPase
MSGAPAQDSSAVAELYRGLREAIAGVVVGQEEAVRLCFVTLLCRGHSLIEGVPGVAKTLLVRTLAGCLGVRFGRVQFTPDLMPSDIIGTPLLDPGAGELRFRPGPLFTDLLLADEINRASAKTQAALLEAMQERSATVDGVKHPLGAHFAVFATQNPVEQEGTYPLPEAELDRFLFKIVMSYPSEEEERALLARHHAEDAGDALPHRVVAPEELEEARRIARAVVVSEEVLAYAASLVRATRADLHFTLGGSPRAGVLLLRAAKALAALAGRDFVLPEDVQEAWLPALRHRVLLEPTAEVEGLVADEALLRSLESVTVPR